MAACGCLASAVPAPTSASDARRRAHGSNGGASKPQQPFHRVARHVHAVFLQRAVQNVHNATFDKRLHQHC